jgi:hypothetical protein
VRPVSAHLFAHAEPASRPTRVESEVGSRCSWSPARSQGARVSQTTSTRQDGLQRGTTPEGFHPPPNTWHESQAGGTGRGEATGCIGQLASQLSSGPVPSPSNEFKDRRGAISLWQYRFFAFMDGRHIGVVTANFPRLSYAELLLSNADIP